MNEQSRLPLVPECCWPPAATGAADLFAKDSASGQLLAISEQLQLLVLGSAFGADFYSLAR
jgi:hypothetical protein